MGDVYFYEPHDSQTAFHLAIDESAATRFVIRTPRQWGKTTFALNQILLDLIENPNEVGFWVSPYYSQAKAAMKELLSAYPDNRHVFIKSITESNPQISFVNGSTLFFKSAENYDSLRGSSINRLVCDEYAYFRDDVFDDILEPALQVDGKRVLFLSTPRGKNDFWRRYRMGDPTALEYNPDYLSLYSTIEETGDPNRIEAAQKARASVTERTWRQEYLAEFIDGGGQVFTDFEVASGNFFARGARHFAGVDIGKNDDRTAVSVLNERGELVYFHRFELKEQATTDAIITRLTSILGDFANLIAVIETNYESAVWEGVHKNLGRGIRPIRVTAANKSDLVNHLALALERRDVKVTANATELVTELQNYECEYLKSSRSYRYAAPNGKKDDSVMSLVHAKEALRLGRVGSNKITPL